MKQRLREFMYEAGAKQGTQRSAIEVNRCFAPLLGWVLAGRRRAAAGGAVHRGVTGSVQSARRTLLAALTTACQARYEPPNRVRSVLQE